MEYYKNCDGDDRIQATLDQAQGFKLLVELNILMPEASRLWRGFAERLPYHLVEREREWEIKTAKRLKSCAQDVRDLQAHCPHTQVTMKDWYVFHLPSGITFVHPDEWRQSVVPYYVHASPHYPGHTVFVIEAGFFGFDVTPELHDVVAHAGNIYLLRAMRRVGIRSVQPEWTKKTEVSLEEAAESFREHLRALYGSDDVRFKNFESCADELAAC